MGDKWFTAEEKGMQSFIMYDIRQQEGSFGLNGEWFHIRAPHVAKIKLSLKQILALKKKKSMAQALRFKGMLS